MRLMFRNEFPDEQLGLRTKRIVKLVADEIQRLAPQENNAEKLAINALTAAGLKIKDA